MELTETWDRVGNPVVLIVDDLPDNLSMLHDALDEHGYTVLLATHGEAALKRCAQVLPDVVLLDAMMPGMDGFEVVRRLKEDAQTSQIPVIFMTGLTETEYLVAALQAGAVDYVTKPIKPAEVLARMRVHLSGARERRQARNALDAFGYATITVRASDGLLLWQTALAKELLSRYCGPTASQAPTPVREWLAQCIAMLPLQQDPPPLTIERGASHLRLRLHRQVGDIEADADWMIVMREVSDLAVLEALGGAFKLTGKEAQVLYWLVKGKTNKDIGDILECSPMTVKKHLERIFVKMGVETRTAAAGMAMRRIRQSHPQFED